MSIPSSHQAAFIIAKHTPLQVGQIPYTAARKNEIVVRNKAIAINPLDWILQEAYSIAFPWLKVPFISGCDVAGEVVEIGKDVTRFRLGDRILGHAVSTSKTVNRPCEGGFQEYTVIRQHMASPIPANISYETASVIPLGLSTAACALFQKDYLALTFPTAKPEPTGKTVLIWGGSTSVGCNTIQLARAAGYEVISTASPKNHGLLRKLGAALVFDYKSPTVIQDIIAAFEKRECAGAVAIGPGSFKACVEVAASCKGNKFVAQASFDLPPFPKGTLDFPGFMFAFMKESVTSNLRLWSKGVRAKTLSGDTLEGNEVGPAIYEVFLPAALRDGRFIPAPDPQVVGHGLERVQEAMNMSKKGVSAKKLVITL